jgi:FAD/FMN-containing dehydrogenase
MTTRQELPRTLRRSLGEDAVVTDPDVVASYRADQAGLVEAGWPSAVVFPRTTSEVVEACAAALALGGTVTGEHGVGLLKRAHLRDELGPVGMRLQRAVKDAFDPGGSSTPARSSDGVPSRGVRCGG